MQKHEVRAFTNLLRPIYRQEIHIGGAYDLITLTKMAEYYRALKAVSWALDRVLFKEPYFQNEEKLCHDACVLIDYVAKLRHAVLFRELANDCAGS